MKVCKDKEIVANIYPNGRNEKGPGIDHAYFDELLYKRRIKIEQINELMTSVKSLCSGMNSRPKTGLA